MNAFTEYLFHIIAVCVVAAAAKQLLHGSAHFKSLGNLICGVFVLLSVISPFVDLSWNTAMSKNLDFSQQLNAISMDAQMYREESMRQSILSQTQAYIWNKAKELSLDMEFDITLSGDYPYAPCRIQIIGHASPYAKAKLSDYLQESIGIPKEAQTWISG